MKSETVETLNYGAGVMKGRRDAGVLIERFIIQMGKINGDATKCVHADPRDCLNHSLISEAQRFIESTNKERKP